MRHTVQAWQSPIPKESGSTVYVIADDDETASQSFLSVADESYHSLSFLKEYTPFLAVPLLLLLLQLLILHISGTELQNTSYIVALTLTLYAVFFCMMAVRYYFHVRSFKAALRQPEQEDVYEQDEDFETAEKSFTLTEKTALRTIQKIKAENTALKAEARRLIDEQNDYFALWIHQMKTPIASLNVLLQNQDDDKDGYFEMQKALLNIENYTQMALQYLKLHGTGHDLYFSSVSLDAILRTILRKYRSFFIYKNIDLDYEPVNLTVISEAVLCEVMIEQIISNSLKYCTVGKRKGHIGIRRDREAIAETDDSNRHIPAIVIEDNGTGIAAADLPKIFDKGYSGLNGKLAEKATGLGLYLAKEIAKRINCTLEIGSEYGKGTCARIEFMKPVYSGADIKNKAPDLSY